MKNFLLVFILFAGLFGYSQADSISTAPQEDASTVFARERFSELISRDFSAIEGLYLTREEGKKLVEKYEPGDSLEKERMLKSYDAQRKLFLESYKSVLSPLNLKMAQSDSINWQQVQVDSIRYNYVIVLKGADKRINWPESASYLPAAEDLLVCKTYLFFHDGQQHYIFNFQSLYLDDEWRFFENLREPRLGRRD